MSAAISTRWEIPLLLTKLATLGWGPFHGRKHAGVVKVLRGLSDRLDYKTGMGEATLFQVADAANLSKRWTRHCLNVLEAYGLVKWSRGGVANGKQVPSFFKIVKRKLVALIRAARKGHLKRWERRNLETHHRLAVTNPKMVFPKKRSTKPIASGAGGTDSPPDPPKGGGNITRVPHPREVYSAQPALPLGGVPKRRDAIAPPSYLIASRVREARERALEQVETLKAHEESVEAFRETGLTSKERVMAMVRESKEKRRLEHRFGKPKKSGGEEMGRIAHRYNEKCKCFTCENARPFIKAQQEMQRRIREEEEKKLEAIHEEQYQKTLKELEEKRIKAEMESESRIAALKASHPGMSIKEILVAQARSRLAKNPLPKRKTFWA